MKLFTSRVRHSVQAHGERTIIAQIPSWLGKANPAPPRGIGDDCAVLRPLKGTHVMTVDPVIYGRHFDDSASPESVGAKLLKRNLSDLAAMGAKPTAAVVALLLAPNVNASWLKKFYQGLGTAAVRYGVEIVGGDVAQLETGFAASLTLLGRASSKRILTRRGARIGDFIYITGKLGGSLLGHHLTFEPRLAEGAWLAARTEVRSLMDLSDGLAKDLYSLTPPQARPALVPENFPIARAAFQLAKKTQENALHHALTDGEDYELLFSVDQRADRVKFEAAWRNRFRLPLSLIGKFVAQTEPVGREIPLKNLKGYEHLR